jgi:septum formation topological specificity factor MinE
MSWNDLPYIGGSSTTIPELQDYVTKDELETLVKKYLPSSDKENQIKVLNDGTMEINSVNITKLVQTEGDMLILDGSM